MKAAGDLGGLGVTTTELRGLKRSFVIPWSWIAAPEKREKRSQYGRGTSCGRSRDEQRRGRSALEVMGDAPPLEEVAEEVRSEVDVLCS